MNYIKTSPSLNTLKSQSFEELDELMTIGQFIRYQYATKTMDNAELINKVQAGEITAENVCKLS